MNFAAIDFETANEQRCSPCSIGIAIVENGRIVDRFYRLLKPKECRFRPFNTHIHGIDESMVRNEPEWCDMWEEIEQLLRGRTVIAHNASFDLSVLRHTLELYDIPYPLIDYSCTLLISRSMWPDFLSYKLSAVSAALGIDFERHHNAEEDALACANIALRACEESQVSSLGELAECLEISHGHINPFGYTPARCNRQLRRNRSSRAIDVNDITPEVDNFDVSHYFYGKVFVFTGALDTMKREDAMQVVVNHGGELKTGVSKKVNVLVVGEQDYRVFASGHKKSSKLRKAEELKQKGIDIELMSEDDFLRML